MTDSFKQCILDYLQSHGVDIRDWNYKHSENYIKIKDRRIFDYNYDTMSLGEFIERHLLDKIDVLDTYESIYDMGNPYELCDEECRDIAIASEIIRFSETTDEAAAMNEYKNSIDWQDEVALAKEAKKEEAKELAKLFSRPGGYRERLKKSLNLDLDLFDKNS